MAKNTTTPSLLGHSFVNLSASSFAVLPGPSTMRIDTADLDGYFVEVAGESDLGTIDEVERLIAASLRRGTNKAKVEFLRSLAAMKDEGKVLWPVGLFWNQSAIGPIPEVSVRKLLEELYPESITLRQALAELPTIRRLSTEIAQKNYVSVFWKLIMALRMAVQDVPTLEGVHDGHMKILAGVLKPSGAWAPWLGSAHTKMIRSLVSGIGELRNDPAFGEALGRIQYSGRGARAMSKHLTHPWLEWIDTDFERWIDALRFLQKKGPRRGKKLLLDYLSTRPQETTLSPDLAFSRDSIAGLMEFAGDWGTPYTRLYAIGKVLDFATWLSDESRDDRGKPSFILPMTATDLERFKTQQGPMQPRNAEVAARPMPQRYHAMLKEVIAGDDFAWPKSLQTDRGVPKLWTTWTDPKTGVGQSVFCEVLPRLLMLLLDLPLRTIQGRRLDSGEGDSERWNAQTGAWEPNTGQLAGYWSRAKAKNARRGVVRRIDGVGPDGGHISGLYINSNKTQDRNVLFDETSGYEIPWQHEEVLQNLAAMRSWQEKFNPVTRPLAFDEVPAAIFKDEPSATVRGLQPARFYLFRDPTNAGLRGREAPPTYAALLQFFHDALSELERRLNAEDPTANIRIITRRDPSGLPKQAIYTMHGMRASTITALYSEGVPIGVLSKLVAGHATILMTLKYVKYEPGHVSEVLTLARQKALAGGVESFSAELGRASYEQAARMTAYLAADGLEQARGQYAERSAWASMDIGICPNGQTLCNIGGERIFKRQEAGKPDKSQYRPVPGGPRNCVRCRFFVTGLPFLIPLCGQANVISARTERVAGRIEAIKQELQDLKRQRHTLAVTGGDIPEEMRRRIRVLEAEWETNEAQRDQHLADFHATATLVEKIRALARVGTEDGKLPMLLNDEGVPEFVGRESTRFELTDAVVQMSRFFPSLASEDIERERNEFIDRVLYREGFVPFAMSPLSADERRRGADALAALLLGELGAQETENLIEGRKTLADLGIQHGFDDAVQRALGKPLDRVGPPRRERPMIVDLAPAEPVK